MERLTKRSEKGYAYFPKCFEEPCLGMGDCLDKKCDLMSEVCEKLATYEDLEEAGLACDIAMSYRYNCMGYMRNGYSGKCGKWNRIHQR